MDACSQESNLLEKFNLKPEQDQAVRDLLSGKDVLGVLPTGFGKSRIFQAFTSVKNEETNGRVVVLVIAPLSSIIQDQVNKMNSLGYLAADLSNLTVEDIKSCKFKLLLSSPEEVVKPEFQDELKDSTSELHNRLACIVVDESHTVETWTGLRPKRKHQRARGQTEAFRSAFAKISNLRSLCKEDVPLLALTGTADLTTQRTICEVLLMDAPSKIFISPNRKNLRFSVEKTTKEEMSDSLNWLANLLQEQGCKTPKTIIFCNTLKEIAVVFNELLFKLGNNAYWPRTVPKQNQNLLIGIFHSLSWKQNKDRIFESFKENGTKRVIIASTALSMGVDFPDVRYIINWGPARSLLDQHQEAGRAGRDGKQSHVIIVYHGHQLSNCDDDVKMFVKAEGCYRIAGYKTFDPNITPLDPGHLCCSNCAKSCTCQQDDCKITLEFESKCKNVEIEQNVMVRPVSMEDRQDVREALMEIKDSMPSGCNAFGPVTSHGFSDELIQSIVEKCHMLFTVNDIMNYLPVFSVHHSLKILEILFEIFNDIPNLDSVLDIFNGYEFEESSDLFPDFSLQDFESDNESLGGDLTLTT